MKWVAIGKTNPEIAAILGIAPASVKNHMCNIFNKLGANNRIEAVNAMNKLNPR